MEQSKFILEIQLRPCIWNPRVESYLDRGLKRKAWEEVAAKMCKDFGSFSDDEKRKTVLELQKKWKCLKDYYKRRNVKDDIDEKTKRPKPIVELLKFLDEVTQFEIDMRLKRASKQYIRMKRSKEIVPTYESTLNCKNVRSDKSAIISRNALVLDRLSRQKLESESNLNFLESLLPDMQSLNDQQRFEFKLGVMQLIKKIKYDEEVEDTLNTFNNTAISQDIEIISDPPNVTFGRSPRSMSPLNFAVKQYNDHVTITPINNPSFGFTVNEELDGDFHDFS